MPDSSRALLVVPHTHWDREWYLAHETFRVRLLELLDDVLDLAERDGELPCFTLDGQTIVLDDYLEVRPQERTRLERLVRAGRLVVGPWYVLPDEWLVSGEALIRNLRLGLRTAQAFGGALGIGYVPDQFGHVGQLPQILRGFGLDAAALWRGVGATVETTCFDWEAPDGSRVRTLHLATGYGNGAHLPLEPRALAARLARETKKLEPFARGGPLVLMNGVDHMRPQPGLQRALAAVAPGLGMELRCTTIEGALRAVSESHDAWPVHRGELRSGLRSPLLSGCASARIPLKQADVRNDVLLTRVLEPLSAWLAALGGRADRDLLQHAWRIALQNHPHDSICGCSIDAVHEQMRPRFERVAEIAQAELVRVARELSSHFDDPPEAGVRGAGDAILVWSAHAAGANEVDGEIELVPPAGRGLEAKRGQRLALHLRDAAGRRIPAEAEVVAPGFRWEITLPRAAAAAILPDLQRELLSYFVNAIEWRREGDRLRIEARIDGTPSRAFDAPAAREALVRALEAPDLAQVTIRATRSARVRLRFVDVLPGYGARVYRVHAGHARPRDEALRATRDADGCVVLENAVWRVEVDGAGRVGLFHRKSGERIDDALRLVDEGDRGDSYDFDPVPQGERVERLERVRCRVLPTGSAAASLELRGVLRVPRRLAADRRRRERAHVTLPLRIVVRLPAGLDRVDLDLMLDNRALDHRVRWHVRAPLRATRLRVESAFELAERPIEPPPDAFGSTFCASTPSGATPQRSAAMIDDARRALVVANRGAPEIEAVHESDGRSALAVTLLRSVGWLSLGDLASRPLPAGPVLPTPGAQGLGSARMELSIRMVDASDETALAQAHRFAAAPVPLPHAGAGQPSLGHEASLLGIDDPVALVSAIEPTPERAIDVRIWSPSDHPRVLALQLPMGKGSTSARPFDLAACPTSAGPTLGSLQLPAHGIVTVRLAAP